MRRPMIVLAVLIIASFWSLALLITQAPAKQVAERPVISEKRAAPSFSTCRADVNAARRITWLLRDRDGSVKAAGFVIVRKCSW
ncbi:hypothetical protein EFR84_11450 [Rhizobium chutanense]|uniref:Uncharacterized protein n=1 Tax=Rhizobium chutanense TaxID=2035448 RepID=A0A3S0S2H0_9HYPH|nr:hypothetical protein EFR84_11450 [Rhizobium chutanense]